MRSGFAAGACLDLGAFDPHAQDCGVAAWLDRAAHVPAWVVVMEDREPVFFHDYAGYNAHATVPLNRHGPRDDRWTQADLKRLVDALHAHDVKVLLGYWIHEGRFLDDDHPELLIRDAQGSLWQDRAEKNADFNPMRRMKADPKRDIAEGERYYDWAGRQYQRLARAFGFDGLFLGDGAMGFRRHGKDWKDLRHFDFHEDWLAEFRADAAFMEHEGCALDKPGAAPEAQSKDVLTYHWPHWVAWNTDRWTEYYRATAQAVHDADGILAAYNCMNYDPSLARLHGVDYRAIAEAGLDILVFQAYDYAWGPLGPFGFLPIARKDLATNLKALLRTRAHVGHDTRMRIVVTVETEDEVETWNAPVPHTLGEAFAYGEAVSFDGATWRRAADGAFVVWGNSVPHDEWRQLAVAFERLSRPPEAPRGATLWSAGEERLLADRGVPLAIEPDKLYAHLDVLPVAGEGGGVGAILRSEDAAAQPLASVRRAAPRARSTRATVR